MTVEVMADKVVAAMKEGQGYSSEQMRRLVRKVFPKITVLELIRVSHLLMKSS